MDCTLPWHISQYFNLEFHSLLMLVGFLGALSLLVIRFISIVEISPLEARGLTPPRWAGDRSGGLSPCRVS